MPPASLPKCDCLAQSYPERKSHHRGDGSIILHSVISPDARFEGIKTYIRSPSCHRRSSTGGAGTSLLYPSSRHLSSSLPRPYIETGAPFFFWSAPQILSHHATPSRTDLATFLPLSFLISRWYPKIRFGWSIRLNTRERVSEGTTEDPPLSITLLA
jgi:hypothetical protein